MYKPCTLGLLNGVEMVGNVFVGEFSPEKCVSRRFVSFRFHFPSPMTNPITQTLPFSCGDRFGHKPHTPDLRLLAHVLGVNIHTFLKHITIQQLTPHGLDAFGTTVMQLAEVEGLEDHEEIRWSVVEVVISLPYSKCR